MDIVALKVEKNIPRRTVLNSVPLDPEFDSLPYLFSRISYFAFTVILLAMPDKGCYQPLCFGVFPSSRHSVKSDPQSSARRQN